MPRDTNIDRVHNVYRVHDLASEITEQNAHMREVIAKSKEILRTPAPDTFLGRATQDPALSGYVASS